MSLSRRLRISILASAVVVLSTVAVAVAVPAHTGAQRGAPAADRAAAATFHNGYATRVIGSFANKGTVRGSFVPTRSYVVGNRTIVQGDLIVTLRRAGGSLVGGVTRHDLSLPVKASGAHLGAAAAPAATSCPILHLTLGPLDLNLLGLTVHLDRVVLDITAQSGPGNLLGNLLCAVAHQLDATNPTALNLLQLSSLLNRVIALLT